MGEGTYKHVQEWRVTLPKVKLLAGRRLCPSGLGFLSSSDWLSMLHPIVSLRMGFWTSSISPDLGALAISPSWSLAHCSPVLICKINRLFQIHSPRSKRCWDPVFSMYLTASLSAQSCSPTSPAEFLPSTCSQPFSFQEAEEDAQLGLAPSPALV